MINTAPVVDLTQVEVGSEADIEELVDMLDADEVEGEGDEGAEDMGDESGEDVCQDDCAEEIGDGLGVAMEEVVYEVNDVEADFDSVSTRRFVFFCVFFLV